MATSSIQDIDDILLCPICLEKLRNPKYLPCLHTFCEECIRTYISSGFQKGNTKTLECPVCRNIIPAPKDDCSHAEWAKLLPVNFLIIGLLDKEKAQRPEKQCMSCERLVVTSTASFICLECADILCENCCRCHKANKYTFGHEIKLLSDVPKDETFLKSFKNKCSDHPTKNLKLFCVDHDTPCCSMCVTITHRKCGDIISIEDAAKQFVSNKNVETVQRDLQNCKKHMKTIIGCTKSRLSDLELQYQSKLESVEKQYQNLVTEVQAIQVLRKGELLKLYDEKKGEIEATKIAFENRLKAIENEEGILKVSISRASEVQVMIESKKILQKSEEHKQFLAEGNIKCETEFKLKLSNLEQVETITEQLRNMCQVTYEVIQSDKCLDYTSKESLTSIDMIESVIDETCVNFKCQPLTTSIDITEEKTSNNDDDEKEIFNAESLDSDIAESRVLIQAEWHPIIGKPESAMKSDRGLKSRGARGYLFRKSRRK